MKKSEMVVVLLAVCFLGAGVTTCLAKPDASVKSKVIRLGTQNPGKEQLILPYAFPSESMGTTGGVGGMTKGYGQDQLILGATVYGSVDDAWGVILGAWDYRLPMTERFYFTGIGSISHFPRQRAYTEVPRRPDGSIPPEAGTNNSNEDNYIEDEGDSNWYELRFEYVLPIGSMESSSIAEYNLKDGILQSGATGGDVWNPLTSGVSIFLVGQSGTYQNYETDTVTLSGDTFPFEFAYYYNNTDFPINPSKGSSQYLSYSQDFSSGQAGGWNFLEFEASKYFDLGTSHRARQRVVALNFWTGSSPSWSVETNPIDGREVVVDNPPFLEGATLGGFYRMRAYPLYRYNDRSVIYTTAEYRYTLKWNPVEGVDWLRWLRLDWFQLVPFVEGGRVAGDYGDLFSDWKFDVGLGIRALMAGAVVRFDMAFGEEGGAGWVMFGQPF